MGDVSGGSRRQSHGQARSRTESRRICGDWHGPVLLAGPTYETLQNHTQSASGYAPQELRRGRRTRRLPARERGCGQQQGPSASVNSAPAPRSSPGAPALLVGQRRPDGLEDADRSIVSPTQAVTDGSYGHLHGSISMSTARVLQQLTQRAGRRARTFPERRRAAARRDEFNQRALWIVARGCARPRPDRDHEPAARLEHAAAFTQRAEGSSSSITAT